MRGPVLLVLFAVLLLQSGPLRAREDFIPHQVLKAAIGDSLTIPCGPYIADFMSVSWSKDKQQIYSNRTRIIGDERFQLVNETSLKISAIVPSDSGQYVCQFLTEPNVGVVHPLKVLSNPSTSQRCSNKSARWVDLGGDYCYLIEQERYVSWIQAVYECYQEGGSLATLRSMEEIKRIRGYTKDKNSHLEKYSHLYIGLWKHWDGSFEWVDSSTSNFRNWWQHAPNDIGEKCVEFDTVNGMWNDVSCYKEIGYLCSARKDESPLEQRKVCPDASSEWNDYGGENCYIIKLDYSTRTTSYEAANRCATAGGHLASFHSIEELAVVSHHLQQYHSHTVHIGFRRNNDGKFEWMDRSPVDLEFWAYRQTNYAERQCAAMSTNGGQWGDIPCDRVEGYICSTPKVNAEISITEQPAPKEAEIICGGDIAEENGTIHSPNYPQNYDPDANCFWKISCTENCQIALTFETFELEYGEECEFDYVKVLDGHELDSTVLRNLCGSEGRQTLLSSGNKMAVIFTSDQMKQRTGFFARFTKVEQCGGSIIADEGVIQSRNYPDNYWPNDFCTWKITVPEGNAIVVKFEAFEVEFSPACNADYVEILDGHDGTSPFLGRYCSTNVSGEIHSSGHKITIKFVSDGSKEYYGFSAEFKKGAVASSTLPLQPLPAAERACGGILESEKGIILSPKYPMTYPHYMDCIWMIKSQLGSEIKLRFKTFNFETSRDCDRDYVEIFDGPSISSPSLGKFCRTRSPRLITSSRNQMTVRFKIESMKYYEYFSAFFYTDAFPPEEDHYRNRNHAFGSEEDEYAYRNHLFAVGEDNYGYPNYAFEPEEDKSGYRNHETDSEESENELQNGCGENIVDDEGVIMSPNYPGNYGPNTKCRWKITVPEDHQIVLTFDAFKVETHITCNYDYVIVLDGTTNRSPVLGKLCGYDIPKEIRSSGNTLMIDFTSDSTGEYTGFSAKFKKDLPSILTGASLGDTNACGGDISSSNGSIESPNYPEPYGPLENCVWRITVPNGYRIALKFNHINTEPNPFCPFDYVTVINGHDEDGSVLRTACDDYGYYVGTIRSSENKMTVKFKSDGSIETTGFSATFQKGN